VELLTQKIHLFDSVLGESDEILGAIEDGLDFEHRVFEILQNCRTTGQIDAAFKQLQLELDNVIEERRAAGKSLLQGFDDRIKDHLQIAEARAREALDRRTSRLRDFLLLSLAVHGAAVEEKQPGEYALSTPSQFMLAADELLESQYQGSFEKDGHERIAYLTKRHPLVKAALAHHLEEGSRSAFSLKYSGNHTIHGMEVLVGRKGWWLNFKVTFTGFEIEDHVLSLGLLEDNGRYLPDEIASANLHRITATPTNWDSNIGLPDEETVTTWLAEQVEALHDQIIERNAQYYLERRSVIDKYYGSGADGEVLAQLRHEVEEKRHQVEQFQLQIDDTVSMTKKMELMRVQDALNDSLFHLQQRLQTEQLSSFDAKRKALQELEQLRQLTWDARLVSAAQWTME